MSHGWLGKKRKLEFVLRLDTIGGSGESIKVIIFDWFCLFQASLHGEWFLRYNFHLAYHVGPDALLPQTGLYIFL